MRFKNRNEHSADNILELNFDDMAIRSASEVINSHLKNRESGELEKDINDNISSDVVILSTYGTFKGHNGVRQSSAKLKELLGDVTYNYNKILIEGDYGYLEWSVDSEHVSVDDGADSFVVKEGKIVFQTAHYTVKKKN